MKKFLLSFLLLALVFGLLFPLPAAMVKAEDKVVSVTVVWDDNNDALKIRPESLTVEVGDYDHTDPNIEVTLTSANSWTWTLPADEVHKAGRYHLDFTQSVPGYRLTSEKVGFGTFTITAKLFTNTEVTVTNKWIDKNNADGQRPQAVMVQLYGDDKAYGEPVKLDQANNWKHQWTGLKKGVTWDVRKIGDDEHYFTGVESNDEHSEFTINSYHEKTPNLVAAKIVWDDQNDLLGYRSNVLVMYVRDSGFPLYVGNAGEHNHWKVFKVLKSDEDGYVNPAPRLGYSVTDTLVPGTKHVHTFTYTLSHNPLADPDPQAAAKPKVIPVVGPDGQPLANAVAKDLQTKDVYNNNVWQSVPASEITQWRVMVAPATEADLNLPSDALDMLQDQQKCFYKIEVQEWWPAHNDWLVDEDARVTLQLEKEASVKDAVLSSAYVRIENYNEDRRWLLPLRAEKLKDLDDKFEFQAIPEGYYVFGFEKKEAEATETEAPNNGPGYVRNPMLRPQEPVAPSEPATTVQEPAAEATAQPTQKLPATGAMSYELPALVLLLSALFILKKRA